MKCPKCGYLGFETTDRCRNCGYDFSLAAAGRTPTELPLQTSDAGSALADLDLSATGDRDAGVGVDLDRIIGATSPDSVTPSRALGEALPLFPQESSEDAPLITIPRPSRPPLAVRRTTPDRTRARVLTPPPQEEFGLEQFDATSEKSEQAAPVEPVVGEGVTAIAAGHQPRLLATLVDVLLLAVIDGIVLYLTLAMAGLGMEGLASVPIVPLLAFLAILDGGYLVAFVAASGQTIGKMVTGIRVMGDDGHRVDIGGAVLRAAGCGLSAVTLGLGYLPAFVTADGRALHDRIAGTRVVSAR
jgi:uncharacterized RDD family membrane protein YckC